MFKRRGEKWSLSPSWWLLNHVTAFILTVSSRAIKPLLIISFACLHIHSLMPVYWHQWTRSLVDSHFFFQLYQHPSLSPLCVCVCLCFSSVHEVIHHMVHMLFLQKTLTLWNSLSMQHEKELFSAVKLWPWRVIGLLPSSSLLSVPRPVSAPCQQQTTLLSRPILAPCHSISHCDFMPLCVCVCQTGRLPHWPFCSGERLSPSSPSCWRSSRSASAPGVAATSPYPSYSSLQVRRTQRRANLIFCVRLHIFRNQEHHQNVQLTMYNYVISSLLSCSDPQWCSRCATWFSFPSSSSRRSAWGCTMSLTGVMAWPGDPPSSLSEEPSSTASTPRTMKTTTKRACWNVLHPVYDKDI